MLFNALKVLVIGLATGILAGIFGVGGALLSTPAIRLLLNAPPLIAVGTTLPVIVPTAVSGGIVYWRRGLIDSKVAIWTALGGILGAILGAGITKFISGQYLLIITGFVILYVGIRFLLESKHVGARRFCGAINKGDVSVRPGLTQLSSSMSLAIGLAAGFVGGLLGIGGGIILIPAFVWMGKMPPKTAFGTSLITIAALAIPGSVVHFLLKHIDATIMTWLILGAIPGGWVGARFTQKAKERFLVTAFGLFLVFVAIYFGLSELLATSV